MTASKLQVRYFTTYIATLDYTRFSSNSGTYNHFNHKYADAVTKEFLIFILAPNMPTSTANLKTHILE